MRSSSRRARSRTRAPFPSWATSTLGFSPARRRNTDWLVREQRRVRDPRQRLDHLRAAHAHLPREHVVVEPFEHGDDRERRDHGVEVGWLRRADALRQYEREATEKLAAQPAELVAA